MTPPPTNNSEKLGKLHWLFQLYLGLSDEKTKILEERIQEELAQQRREVLEEAAKIAENPWIAASKIAETIRALKDKP